MENNKPYHEQEYTPYIKMEYGIRDIRRYLPMEKEMFAGKSEEECSRMLQPRVRFDICLEIMLEEQKLLFEKYLGKNGN